jgi:hypothetical protein
MVRARRARDVGSAGVGARDAAADEGGSGTRRRAAVPRALTCAAQPLALALHPHAALAAAGLVSGECQLWDFGGEQGLGGKRTKGTPDPRLRGACGARSEDFGSCRVASFSGASGDEGAGGAVRLALGYSGGALWVGDVEAAGAGSWSAPIGAHGGPVSTLRWLSSDVLAAGDEKGTVSLWDVRSKGGAPVATQSQQRDYISDMQAVDKTLLATAGDGTLAAYELKMGLRKLSLLKRSDDQEQDLLCLQVMQYGKKVAVGTLDGVLNVWSWGKWADLSDRFPGHPESIQVMLKLDEQTVLTGGGDGLIRVVSLFPNRLLGILGEGDDPVERLAWSFDRMLVASATHDNRIRFFDASILHDGSDDEDQDEEGKQEQDCSATFAKVGSEGEEDEGEEDEDGSGEDDLEEDEDEDGDGASDIVDGSDGGSGDSDDSDSDAGSVQKGPRGKGLVPGKQGYMSGKNDARTNTAAAKGRAGKAAAQESSDDDSDGSDGDDPSKGKRKGQGGRPSIKDVKRRKAEDFFSDL